MSKLVLAILSIEIYVCVSGTTDILDTIEGPGGRYCAIRST
jgi:hypothetical protein